MESLKELLLIPCAILWFPALAIYIFSSWIKLNIRNWNKSRIVKISAWFVLMSKDTSLESLKEEYKKILLQWENLIEFLIFPMFGMYLFLLLSLLLSLTVFRGFTLLFEVSILIAGMFIALPVYLYSIESLYSVISKKLQQIST